MNGRRIPNFDQLTFRQRQEHINIHLVNITDDSAGKTNWFALEEFVKAIGMVAEKKSIPLAHEVGLRRGQIERNFLTVFGKYWLDERDGYAVPNETALSNGVGVFIEDVVCQVINLARYGDVSHLVRALDGYNLTYI